MRFQSLNEWLRWQEGLHPKAIDLGLARVREVAETLGLLKPSATVITVAGTNGKGSCVATLAGVLSLAGKRYGAYTSPHILSYNERISFNGVNATDEQLCEAFDAIDRARNEVSLSYFEFATLAALYLFSKQSLDYWLLEVGLGGRLDATNIIDPDIAIITSIDIDHVEWLGDNRESIGLEKAGICRKNVPLICADSNPPQSILNVANELSCPFYLLGTHFGVKSSESELSLWGQVFSYRVVQLQLPSASVVAALQAMSLVGEIDRLNQLEEPVDLSKSLEGLSLSGRMQDQLFKGKRIVLDVAHNPAAMKHLVQQLASRFPATKFSVVLVMMEDKNTLESISDLAPVAEKWLVTTIEDFPRAAKARDLYSQVCQVIPEAYVSICNNISNALCRAVDSEAEFILVTGSFYGVAEASAYIKTMGDN